MTELQEQILSVYKAFKNLCDQNNLRYFACGGTLLGAVRHQGFIPWDDDIDIGMPLVDYEKLIAIMRSSAQTNSAGDYELLEYPWFGAKFHNKNSTFTHALYLDRPEMYTGVFIDVFAFIGLPDEAAERASFTQRMQSLVTKAGLKDFYDYGSDENEAIIANICELKAKYGFDKAEYVAIFSFTNFEHSGSSFRNLEQAPFEDTTISIPSEHSKALTTQYGDYMTLPAETERNSQHLILSLIDLDVPYKEYAQRFASFLADNKFKDSFVKIKHHAGMLEDLREGLAVSVRDLQAELNMKMQMFNDEKQAILNSSSYKVGHKLLTPARAIRKVVSRGND